MITIVLHLVDHRADEEACPKHIVRESFANPYESVIHQNEEAVEEVAPSSSISKEPKAADIARRRIQLKIRGESNPAAIAKLVREKCFINRFDDE